MGRRPRFTAPFETATARVRGRKRDPFSFPDSQTFYLGQTLIRAPRLRSPAPTSRAAAPRAGRLQPGTGGIIIKIPLKVTMATAC